MDKIGTINENGAVYPPYCLDGKTPALQGMDTVSLGNGHFAVIPPYYKGDVDHEVATLKTQFLRKGKVTKDSE